MLTNYELEIQRSLDQLASKPREANSTLTFLEECQDDHRAILEQDCGRTMGLFYYYYDLIAKLLIKANHTHGDWTKNKEVIHLFLHSNLKTVLSAFERAVNGFYNDSGILIRPVYEAVVFCIFIACYPDCAQYAWFDDETVRRDFPGKRNFNLTAFIRDDLKLDWNTYKILSLTSHLNRFEVLREHKKFYEERKSEPMHQEIRFDRDEYSFGINYVNHVIYAYLKIILTFFLNETGKDFTQQEQEEANYALEQLQKLLLTSKENFWAKVTEDFDDVVDMLVVSERTTEQNWKDTWNKFILLRWLNIACFKETSN